MLNGSHAEYFKMLDVQAGAWRPWRINPWLVLNGGYVMDERTATPSEYVRLDNTGFASATAELTHALSAQLQYRSGVRSYLNLNRTDFNQISTLRFTYAFCDHASVATYVSYGRNDSNVSADNYEVLEAGGGVSLSVGF